MKRLRVFAIGFGAVLAVPAVLTIAVFAHARRPPPELVLGPIVETRSGSVQGAVVDDVLVYRGVPFAAPPLGELRWRAPQPVQPWSDVLRTVRFKPACMQTASGIPGIPLEPISEDCLYLNVWTPRDRPSRRLPVMVYLHGGGGVRGSPSTYIYWGDELVRRGVITVNVAYRVGVFGWLAHPELTEEASYMASGNYAVLDMIAGLRWVRDNIEAFGGDPNNVTLFGQSAGAYNASRLMASPLAKGLIHKVIGQSGGDFYPAGMPGGNLHLADAERAGVAFAKTLGVTSLAELRKLSAETLAAAPLSLPRLPIIDGYAVHGDNQTLYAEGKQHKLPLLVGFNEFEGANLEKSPPADAEEFIASVRREYGEFALRVLEMYPADSDEQAMRSFVRWNGMRGIDWQGATWARLHANSGESDVYVYYFAKHPPFGPLRKLGAAHGAELPYVFGSIPRWMRMFTQWPWKARHDLALTDEIPAYWTNFAKTGSPNGENLTSWPPFNSTSQVLHFGEDATTIGPMPHPEAHALVDEYIDWWRKTQRAAASPSVAAPAASNREVMPNGREF